MGRDSLLRITRSPKSEKCRCTTRSNINSPTIWRIVGLQLAILFSKFLVAPREFLPSSPAFDSRHSQNENLFQCCQDVSMALVRGKWTEA